MIVSEVIRILVVDDDEDDFIILDDLLKEVFGNQYSIDWANSMQAGLNFFAESRHDIIFVDYMLGPDRGLDLVSFVAQSSARVPVILLTGQGNVEIDMAAMQAGASDYLVKGRFDVEQLSRAIRYARDQVRYITQIKNDELKYRLLFERNPVPMWVFDRNSLRFLAVNDAAINQYGYSREEFLSMRTLDLRDAEEQQRLIDFIAHDYKGLVAAGIWRHRRKNGSEIFADIASHEIEYEGKSARMTLAKDVSEQVRVEKALRSAEHRLRQVLTDASDALMVVSAQNIVEFANPAVERLLGRSQAELVGQPTSIPLNVADGQEIKIHRPNGDLRQAEIRTAPTEWEGGPAAVISLRDVTQSREHEKQLRLLERAIAASVNGVVIVDALAEDMPILMVNSAFEHMTGYTASEVIGRNCRFLQGHDRAQPELEPLRECMKSHSECDAILRNYRKDGTLFWNHLAISPVPDQNGTVTHYVGIQSDVTERRRAEDEISYVISHDAITSLSRYSAVESRLSHLLEQAGNTGESVHFLFIDLDRFHAINESMGHLIGDAALAIIASRLSACLPKSGEVTRFAGDEFVVVVPALGRDGALALAEQIREVISVPVETLGYRLFLTASIGVSQFPEHGNSPLELLRRAEAAKGRAKGQGRDTVCEFSVEQMQAVEDRLVLGAKLRTAVARGELLLHFQPQIRTSDGRVSGFEALLRWTSPEMGSVPPGRFIPIAEALGLMPDLGAWVFDAACRQVREWMDSGHRDFSIGVNVSAQQLQRPDIVERIRDAMQLHGVLPHMMELELTESSLMENVDRLQETLSELKALGVTLSLDDFGTGYSSLAYLKQFSLDKLKIDRSFVRDLPGDADDAAIARTIVAMAHQLRMTVTAEGVETEAQSAFLRELGCDQLQGYYHGRPMPAMEAERLLEVSVVG